MKYQQSVKTLYNAVRQGARKSEYVAPSCQLGSANRFGLGTDKVKEYTDNIHEIPLECFRVLMQKFSAKSTAVPKPAVKIN